MTPPLEPRLAAQRIAIAGLCQAQGVVALDVFGSAADGRFDPARSDYDFIARFAMREGDSLARRYVAFSFQRGARIAARATRRRDDRPPDSQPVPARRGHGIATSVLCRAEYPNICMTL